MSINWNYFLVNQIYFLLILSFFKYNKAVKSKVIPRRDKRKKIIYDFPYKTFRK